MKKMILFLFFLGIGHGLLAGEKKITTSDGVQLYVKVKGSGTPLLYVHGGPGSASLWFEELFGDFMEKHFTVVYLDQRGVGRSASPADDNYSLARLALDFEEVKKELGFESWLTLGHSFGGVLQMGYAELYPQSHKGMIMVNCTIDINDSSCNSWIPKAAELVGEKYIGCDKDTVPMSQRLNEYGGKLREVNEFYKMGSRSPKAFARLDEISAAIPNFNYDFGNYALQNQDYWRNFKPLTAEMEMPVLYFYGTTDYLVGPEHYKGIDFPNLLLWENKGGHIPFIEDKDDLERAILAYVEKYNL